MTENGETTPSREPKHIMASITDDIKVLVRDELELAKSEILPAVKKGGVGAGLFGAAGYFGLNGLSLLFIAGALGIGTLIRHWWALGFVIMAVLVLLVAGILALVGRSQVGKLKNAKPERAVAQAQATVAELRGAVRRGNERAKLPLELDQPADGHALER